MKQAKDFKLKKLVLLETDYVNTSIESCEEDGNDGLSVVLNVYTDDMLKQFDSDNELFEMLMERMISDDGQIVRFCDYVLRTLTDKCSEFYYGDNQYDGNVEDSSLFNEETACFHIPKMISELSDRLHDEIKEQVFSENSDFNQTKDE